MLWAESGPPKGGPYVRYWPERLRAKDEVDGAHQTQSRPEEIELDRLLHVEDRERHEHAERDDLLHDLQLREIEHGVANPIGRHLQDVFEERDAPADENRNDQRTGAQVAQMRVPRERHEDVGADQQSCGCRHCGEIQDSISTLSP